MYHVSSLSLSNGYVCTMRKRGGVTPDAKSLSSANGAYIIYYAYLRSSSTTGPDKHSEQKLMSP